MHDVGLTRWASEAAEPFEKFGAIGVSGETIERFDVRADGDVLAMHTQELRSVLQRASACAGGLETDKHDRRLGIGQSLLQVMDDSAAGGHPTGRDDDERAWVLIEGFRLVRCASELIGATAQWATVLVHQRLHVDIVVFGVFAKDFRCVLRHRAVDEDGQLGNAAGVFEFSDAPDQFLSAANREGRDDERAAALDRCVDDASQFLASIQTGVRAVAVGGFDQQHVGFSDEFGIAKHRSSPTAEVSGKDQMLRR